MLLRLIYEKDAAYLIKLYKPYGIIGYAVSNYVGNLKDWKSIISYCFFMNKAIVI